MEERELILACQRGDEAAFETLVRLHENRVYTLCRRMCRSEDDALEAAQDAFLSAWRGIGSFRGDAAFSTWLYRLAANACVDLLRRRRQETVSLDDDELGYDPPDPAPTPEQAAERAETRALVREGLAELPQDYREVLVLRELQGLTYAEIAETTGLELGTVKSRISRARNLLKNYLLSSGNFFSPQPSKVTECNREEGYR